MNSITMVRPIQQNGAMILEAVAEETMKLSITREIQRMQGLKMEISLLKLEKNHSAEKNLLPRD